MYEKGQKQRRAIVKAANRVFYEKGYGATSFSDIAAASGLHRGNFYHYFRSKSEILDAVIALRLETARALLAGWDDEIAAPLDRLQRFARILPNEAADVVRYGCPMGSLNGELAKDARPLLPVSRAMFDLFLGWLETQFRAMGYTETAPAYARRLLALTQGAALIAQVYDDPEFIQREAGDISAWLESLT